MAFNRGLQTALKAKHIYSRFLTKTKIKLEILKETTKLRRKRKLC